jgi:hypothetical protein
VFSGIFFFGLPCLWIYLAPAMTRPEEAFWLGLGLLVVLTFAHLIIASAKMEVTDVGIRISYLWWTNEYRFEEFRAVSTYRFNIVLERKGGGMNVTFPAIYSGLTDLHDYLKTRIGR